MSSTVSVQRDRGPALRLRRLRTVLAGIALAATSLAAQSRPDLVHKMFGPAHKGMIAIAHRGCHEAAPAHGLGTAPENSLLALEHCVAMGVDMMETDVRRTADGYLIIMHDEQVNRTTEGRGFVENLTLAELEALHLRRNQGGYAEALTGEGVPTLDKLLKAASGRIALNLDVKGPIYAEVVDAVLQAGAADRVTVKAPAGIGSPRLAMVAPYNRVAFMPILQTNGSDLLSIAARQLEGGAPVALELPHIAAEDLAPVARLAAKAGKKVAVNTLGEGSLTGRPGDNDIAQGGDAVWGWAYRQGAMAFQTDKVEALLQYRAEHTSALGD